MSLRNSSGFWRRNWQSLMRWASLSDCNFMQIMFFIGLSGISIVLLIVRKFGLMATMDRETAEILTYVATGLAILCGCGIMWRWSSWRHDER